MNFKLSGNKMINGDIIKPELVYATFSDDLAPGEAQKIVSSLNYGSVMLMAYRQHRDNLHIKNVITMIEKMEAVFRKYDYEMFEIKRSGK